MSNSFVPIISGPDLYLYAVRLSDNNWWRVWPLTSLYFGTPYIWGVNVGAIPHFECHIVGGIENLQSQHMALVCGERL